MTNNLPRHIKLKKVRGGGDIPFFSIVILSYNKESFIEKCLESCINQTFTSIEIIIVDDCSQDKTISILEKYKQVNYLSIIKNTINSGAFASRIIGEEHAKGEYIIHVDGDDFVETTMCEILYQYCKSKQWDIIAYGWINIKINGKQTNMCHALGEHPIEDLIGQIGMATFVFKKENVHKANKLFLQIFSQKLPHLNNLEDALKPFIVTLLSNTYLGIQDLLYFCQNNPQSMTANCNNIDKNYKMMQDLYLVMQSMFAILDYIQLPQNRKKTITRKIKKYLNPSICSYTYIYYHSKAYSNKLFAYPINFLQSLYYARSLKLFSKTLIRLFVYFTTFGKIKL